VSFGVALWNIQSAVLLVLLVLGKLNMPDQPALVAGYQALPIAFRAFILVTAILKTALLIAAGIAYFGRRRAGRILGTSYAIVSIAESAVAVAIFGIVGREAIIGILFAVFTLLAVNTKYKSALTR
jgi:hypothetical protein